jgi:hypothetical protein
MAIAKRTNRDTVATTAATERKAAAFISRAGQGAEEEPAQANKKPTMIRIPPDLLTRITRGAKRLGISRSAFIVQSAAEKLERMN